MPAPIQTLPELLTDYLRRITTYTAALTLYTQNSVNYAIGKAASGIGVEAGALYRALLRRYTLLGSAGADLTEVLEEYGTPRRSATRARVLCIVRPHVQEVLNITAGRIEVDDSTNFGAGASLRIRSGDGSVTEIATVASVSSGTGPNGGDELDVGSLASTYDPSTDDVYVLRRWTIPSGTSVATDAGVSFDTLDDVTVGDLNPVLNGESSALALNDKVWAECTVAGERGNIDALTVSDFTTPISEVKSVLNPERGQGGNPEETDLAGKRRAISHPSTQAQATGAFYEAMCRLGSNKVLRVFVETTTSINTVSLSVLARNGGGLNADERAALGRYVQERIRSQTTVLISNVVLTSIEVEASVSLDPGPDSARVRLIAAWRNAADNLATFLDYRKWKQGQAVDEADLLNGVKTATGVATLVTSTFSPTADTTVAATSIPVLVRLTLTDTGSGETYGATLTPEF